MKTILSNRRLFTIDDISMVSSLNQAYVNMRLEERFSNNKWFGSRNMLFVGDLLQLPPVAGSPVFEDSPKSLLNQLGCAAPANMQRDCVTYAELTINEWQKNDLQFSSVLDNMRCGCPTEETEDSVGQIYTGAIADKFTALQQSGRTPAEFKIRIKFCVAKMATQFNFRVANF